MGELWGASNLKYKEVTGVFGMIAWRATSVTSGDTLTLPCKDIVAHAEVDESTAAVLVVAKGTGANINRLTITCTSTDNISGIAIVTK